MNAKNIGQQNLDLSGITCQVCVFQNIILKLKYEVSGLCFGASLPQTTIIVGINCANFVGLAL